MKVALVSEHADPLAAVGGVDAGGQNVHVAGLAAALARLGHTVTVYTRRSDPDAPDTSVLAPGVTVERVPAGPPGPLPKDDLPPYMPEFAAHLRRRWRSDRPDVAHAHFWMSGTAALDAGGDLDVPVVQTFHALGTVKRRWQGGADTSPPARVPGERDIGRRAAAVIATCTDEVKELTAMGVPVERVTVVPCGVDLDLFRPHEAALRDDLGPLDAGRAGHDGRARILSIGRLVPRKGVDTVIEALRYVPDAALVVAGGASWPPPGGSAPGCA